MCANQFKHPPRRGPTLERPSDDRPRDFPENTPQGGEELEAPDQQAARDSHPWDESGLPEQGFERPLQAVMPRRLIRFGEGHSTLPLEWLLSCVGISSPMPLRGIAVIECAVGTL
jgi:hypothetical protein